MDILYIVMPTYNESANIESVVKQWYPILDGKDQLSKLVIADGGSTDNTLEILNKLKGEYPKLVVLSQPGTDHGTKVRFLYDYAIKNGADFVFQTDSDGQTNPDEFQTFWDLRSEFDAIIGDRSDRQDGKSRVFVEKVLLVLLKLFFGAKIPDSNAPFRLMKTELLNKYLYKIPEKFNLPNAVLCAYFDHYKEHVTYRHVSFKPRQGGKNYINPKRIVKIGWQCLGNFMKLRKEL